MDDDARGLFAVQFGNEIVGIAAIERARGFHHPAIGQESAAFDQQAGAAGRHLQQTRGFFVQRHRPQMLQGTRFERLFDSVK